MPNTFKNTPETRSEFYKQESGLPRSQDGRGVFVCLMTIQTPQGPIYFANNTEAVTSRGILYNPIAVGITLPTDDGKREPNATIDIDNVTTDLVDEFRNLIEPMEMSLEMVFTEYPDEVEYSLTGLLISNATISRGTISLKLMYQDILNQIFPGYTYNPQEFAGIF